MLSCECWKTFKEIFFIEHLWWLLPINAFIYLTRVIGFLAHKCNLLKRVFYILTHAFSSLTRVFEIFNHAFDIIIDVHKLTQVSWSRICCSKVLAHSCYFLGSTFSLNNLCQFFIAFIRNRGFRRFCWECSIFQKYWHIFILT